MLFKSVVSRIRRERNVYVLSMIAMPFLWSSCAPEMGQEWNQIGTYPVFQVQKGNYTGYNSYPTRIEGIQDIEIRPKVGGYIEGIMVDEGTYVTKGQPLFKLEANTVAQNTKASEAAVNSALARTNAARIEVERLRPLIEKNIISPVQLEAAEADLASAKAQLNQARSDYEGNKANEAYTQIVSPVDGVVGKLNYRTGSLVNATDVTPLTTISNTEFVYAYFSLNERELMELTHKFPGKNLVERLQNFPKVQLELTDHSHYPFEGVMEASTGRINPSTGAIQLRARFNNANAQLLSGSSGTILIPEEYQKVVAVPMQSTFDRQGKKMVYVVDTGDTLKGRMIKIKDRVERYYIVEEGLQVGEKVLALGVNKVYPYTPIIPQLVPMDSIAESFQTVFK